MIRINVRLKRARDVGVARRLRASSAGPDAQVLKNPTAGATGGDFVAQAVSLLRVLHDAPGRRILAVLVFGLVGVICANAVAQIRLNAWQGSFFDAIEQRSLLVFGEQLLVFAVIVAVLLVLRSARPGCTR